MKKVVVGIDIGVKGAIAVMLWSGRPLKIYPIPISVMEMIGGRNRSIYNELALKELFIKLKNKYYIRYVCIERPLSMPGLASFNVGAMFDGFGYIKGVLSGLDINYGTVMANAWTKALLKPIKKKDNETVNAFKKRKKERSIKLVQNKYPEFNIGNNDGYADALLIAEWVRVRVN